MSLEHPMTVTIFPVLVDKEVRLKDILSPTQWTRLMKKENWSQMKLCLVFSFRRDVFLLCSYTFYFYWTSAKTEAEASM